MTSVVVDASAALAWMLTSQASAAADAFLLDVEAMNLVAPAIFEWEVRNVLLSLERRGLLSGRDYETALAILKDLDVESQAPLETAELAAFAAFARETRLSLFDASYLALSLELECRLATRDAGLLAAAREAGVTVIDLRNEVAP